jgi:hypothetical protein
MSPRVCWTRSAIQYATQVDVGGLEIDDPYADAVFRAIHQPLPVKRMRDAGRDKTSSASEKDVLKSFTADIDSNEPLLLFITGKKGTGKSHLVRWMKSQIGVRPKWHVVYVEKRNTSLKRVIERILEGIDTERADQLRRSLNEASDVIRTDQEAMAALLARLRHLVNFDTATEVKGLSGLEDQELRDLRDQVNRLLGHYTFEKVLSEPGGPVERIVRLARGETNPDETIDEADLHLREEDFRVDPSYFTDTGLEFQRLVATVVGHHAMRKDIAALCDAYLPRAKAEVFTGQTTDLLEVFQDVRREIATRGQELCLFIEDLVLLHGIDKQLAQALTIPATRELCRLRAAIAVTSGYLESVDTFRDRGFHYTLDIDANSIGPEGLRDFVARYLNAGRLDEATLRALDPEQKIPNACNTCSIRSACHETFGTSVNGYGLYPFNVHALDALIPLATPDAFRPREVLREVIRDPLDVAEAEVLTPGAFPSSDFAKSLDENRTKLPVELRATIRRDNPDGAEPEISLRAFYVSNPFETDDEIRNVASYFGVALTEGISPNQIEEEEPEDKRKEKSDRSHDEVTLWANGTRLGAGPANKVRKFVCESVASELRNGAYGLPIRKVRTGEWKIGAHTLRYTDVDIEHAFGSGAHSGSTTFPIRRNDENAVLLRGILAADDPTGLVDSVDHGRWYFDFQRRVHDFAQAIASAAQDPAQTKLPAALRVVSTLRYMSASPGHTVADALPAMLRPVPPENANPCVANLFKDTKSVREEALMVIRDSLTTAKGTGAPSILDVGPVLSDIRSILKNREITEIPSGDDDAARVLRTVSTKQLTAARKARTEATSLVSEVGKSLNVTEDLNATFDTVDKLVEQGHNKGELPLEDSRTRYQELRNKVSADAMSLYSRLYSLLQQDSSSGALWDMLADPRPTMTALAQYATFTKTLIGQMEIRFNDNPQPSDIGDAQELIDELKNLAGTLDLLSEAVGS